MRKLGRAKYVAFQRAIVAEWNPGLFDEPETAVIYFAPLHGATPAQSDGLEDEHEQKQDEHETSLEIAPPKFPFPN
jgi:hypothetical protein